MIHDLIHEQPTGTAADVCIIGAGAAGIVLAVELVKLGKRVLLLEGGGDTVEEASQEPYQSVVSGLHHDGIHVGRFRANGGSTQRWGGQILELDDLDFERRSWVEQSGWPIPKADLAPFYARALELEGLADVTLEDDAVWRKLGLAEPTFAAMEPFFSRWCPEPNFARLHRATMSGPGIEVWLHANVVSLVTEGARVSGVRARTLTSTEATFSATNVIFSLGGIESCRFFLQPGFANQPWQQSGLLGKHFQDHIVVKGASIDPIDPARFHQVFDNVFLGGFKYQPKLRLDRASQERHRTLNVAAMINPLSDSDEVAGQMKTTAKNLLRGRWRETGIDDLTRLVRHSPLLLRQTYRYLRQHRAYVPSTARLELTVHCEQRPDGASSIRLAETRDSLGMLRTCIDWQVSDQEVASIRTFVEAAQTAFAGLARITPVPELLNDPDRFRQTCGDGYHHMGGMRMAASATDGLVDLNLRMHGSQNLYVLSSAVFPTSGFSNPTHTLLALAARLAKHLGSQSI